MTVLLLCRKWPLRLAHGCSFSFTLTAVIMSGATSFPSLLMASQTLPCLGAWIYSCLSPGWWGAWLPGAWPSNPCEVSASHSSLPAQRSCKGSLVLGIPCAVGAPCVLPSCECGRLALLQVHGRLALLQIHGILAVLQIHGRLIVFQIHGRLALFQSVEDLLCSKSMEDLLCCKSMEDMDTWK